MLVERCESPEALRADRVEAADWGRCIGILCLGVVATAWGAGCPSARGALLPSAVCRPASEGALVTLHAGALLHNAALQGAPNLFNAPSRLYGALGRIGDVSVDALCCFMAVLGVLPKTASELEGPNIDPC